MTLESILETMDADAKRIAELEAELAERTKERDALAAALGNAEDALDAIEEGRGHCEQYLCANVAMNQRAIRADTSAILAARLATERKAGATKALRILAENYREYCIQGHSDKIEREVESFELAIKRGEVTV